MKHTFAYFLLFSINIAGMSPKNFIILKTYIARTLPDDICKHIDHLYTQLINQERFELKTNIADALPHEICKHIDNLYAQLINKERKKHFIKITHGPNQHHKYETNYQTISNNGHYFIYHNKENIRLITTGETNTFKEIDSGYRTPLHFSHDSKYCIIRDNNETYFYDLITGKEHKPIEPIKQDCYNITISSDSQHVLFEGRHEIHQGNPIYLLWTLNADNVPQPVPLKDDLLHSKCVTFHPDNKHIIHNRYADKLFLYNIETAQNTKISKKRDKNIGYLNKLIITPDSKTILAKAIPKNFAAQPEYILFNIEDIKNVTAITLTPQSCHESAELPIFSIPNKKIHTHITNTGCTLQLVNHQEKNIATHHAPHGTYITALTVDTTGNYIAIGHSNGSIIIWDIYNLDPAQHDKTLIKSTGYVQSLTLTDNQLLLSQSELEHHFVDNSAILWDIYGNEIINFGNNIHSSAISSNGKTINIFSRVRNNKFTAEYLLTTHHQKDETLIKYKSNGPSLAQLSRSIAEQNKKNQI